MQTAILILALLAAPISLALGVLIGATCTFRVMKGMSPVPALARKPKVSVNSGKDAPAPPARKLPSVAA